MQYPDSYTSRQNCHGRPSATGPRQPQQQYFSFTGVAYPSAQAHCSPYSPAPGPSPVVSPRAAAYVYHGNQHAPVFVPPQNSRPASQNPGLYRSPTRDPGFVLDTTGYPIGSPSQAFGHPSPRPLRAHPQDPPAVYTQPYPAQAFRSPPNNQALYRPQRTPPTYPVQVTSYQQCPMAGHQGYTGSDVGLASSPGASQQYLGVPNTTQHGTTVTVLSRSGKPHYVQTFPPGENVTIVMPPRKSSGHRAHEHKSRDRKDRHSKR